MGRAIVGPWLACGSSPHPQGICERDERYREREGKSVSPCVGALTTSHATHVHPQPTIPAAPPANNTLPVPTSRTSLSTSPALPSLLSGCSGPAPSHRITISYVAK